MILVAATAVVQVLLLVVVYVFHWMLVRRVPEGMGYDIEVKLLPPSIRVKLECSDAPMGAGQAANSEAIIESWRS